MPAPRVQRKLSWLAFAAMLLMVVLPTTGRAFGAVPAGMHGMHSGDAGQPAPSPGHARPDSTNPPGAPAHPRGDMHHGGGVCPYCPLLASLIVLPLLRLYLVRAGNEHRDPPWRWSLHGFVAPNGLGPRGPPFAL